MQVNPMVAARTAGQLDVPFELPHRVIIQANLQH
jgi:hypothetical protein